jgi:hypothetical protein
VDVDRGGVRPLGGPHHLFRHVVVIGQPAGQGDRRCARELTAYEGGNPRGKAFTYQSVEPYGDSWKTGDRTLTCIAYKPDNLGGAPVSYSVKGGH